MQGLHSRSILLISFAAPFASAAFAFPATPPSRSIRPPPPLGLSSSNIGSVLPTLSLRLGPGAAARTARKKARMSALDASSQGPFGKGYAPEQEGSEKLHSGPAERNTPPIIDVLKTCMVGFRSSFLFPPCSPHSPFTMIIFIIITATTSLFKFRPAFVDAPHHFHPHPHSPTVNLLPTDIAHPPLPIAMTEAPTEDAHLTHLRHPPHHRQPASGKVLGVAEGSGQHVSAFAKEFPGLEYQPTEIEESALRSISVYTRDYSPPVLRPPPRPNPSLAHGHTTTHNIFGSPHVHAQGWPLYF
jgi:hypothetical protein